jgi:malonyl-CoA O-methyltransferase
VDLDQNYLKEWHKICHLLRLSLNKFFLINPFLVRSIFELEKVYPRAHWRANFQRKKTLKEKLLWFIPPRIKSMNLGEKYDLVWSCNATLKKGAATEGVISNWAEIMSDNSLLMMAYLGPDTGKEFHQFLNEKPPLIDMHDLGDLLVHKGFSDPVMTMEYVTLEYDDLVTLQKELTALLGDFKLDDKDEKQTQALFIDKNLSSKGKWILTLEIVYGHAWKVPRMKNNVVTIDPKSIKTKKNSKIVRYI